MERTLVASIVKMKIQKLINSLLGKGSPSGSLEKPNWDSQRYESVLSERNVFAGLVFFSIIVVIVCVIALLNIVKQKKIDPFVIQIDQSTGEASIVNPLTSSTISSYESLSRYFIKKYISARETYNPADFDTTARRYIKLSSTNEIYNQYIRYIQNKSNDPKIIYGLNNVTYMRLKSWSKVGSNQYICRYSIHETTGDAKVFNKISVIKFDYRDVNKISSEDQDMNPVGFTITAYRTDEDDENR